MDHGGAGPRWTLDRGVSDDLTRARPRGHSRSRQLVGDGATEREEHGESISDFTGAQAAAWRLGDGGEKMVEEVLSAGSAWVWREEKRRGRNALEDGETSAVFTQV
jgi:hypothetical protein